MNLPRLEFPLGVPASAGKRSNVAGVGGENPALKKFPASQAIDTQPAKAGTPNSSGSWPVTCGEPVELAGPKWNKSLSMPARITEPESPSDCPVSLENG
jgi:hypothetical protein